jgi:hypothetical protein
MIRIPERVPKVAMKIQTRLLALVLCAVLPATLVAQPPNESYQGAYLLKISVPGVPWPISAFSMYESDGSLKEIDYLPSENFFGIEAEVGYGHWFQKANGQLVINYKTELPNGQVRQVKALTTLSPSGNELTGMATVKLLNRDGTVVDSKTVEVTGQRAPNRLGTKL